MAVVSEPVTAAVVTPVPGRPLIVTSAPDTEASMMPLRLIASHSLAASVEVVSPDTVMEPSGMMLGRRP